MPRPAKESPPATEASRFVFKLDELEKPKAIDVELSQDFLQRMLAEVETHYRIRGSGHLEGELTGVDRGALLRAELTATVAADCSRCLSPVIDTLKIPMTLRYVPRQEFATRPNAETDTASHATFDPDLDEEPFDGRRIDLAPALREHLMLALPMGELCREDCQGLCPQCGQNKNEKSCDCRPETVDPRWQRLKELKLQN
jgi:uncharacterized protein